MTLFWVAGAALAVIYGLLCGFSGIIQMKKREIALWSAAGMMISGASVAFFALLLNRYPQLLALLIGCLLSIHILTIINGLHLYNKINIKHHLVRFIISAVIIVLLLIS